MAVNPKLFIAKTTGEKCVVSYIIPNASDQFATRVKVMFVSCFMLVVAKSEAFMRGETIHSVA